MQSSKQVIPLSELFGKYTFIAPFPVDFSLNKESWNFRKGDTVELTYDQYEVLNHSDYGNELFGHNV